MFNDVKEELINLFKGKTLDALLPPLVFIVLQNRLGLISATGAAIALSVLISMRRIWTRQSTLYALGGLATVLIAAAFAIYANQASNFYLPGILSTTLLALASLVSLLLKRPLAAWVSHVVRGWTLAWFWRADVKPAYAEVTVLWVVMLGLSAGVQAWFYVQNDLLALAFTNTLFGLPYTILILVITYVYGIWRLRRLGGPGIEEFNQQKKPPYKGQTRGF